MENFDTWGNLRGDPKKVIEETQGDNTIKVMIYQVESVYCYGYQLKVGTLIRQKAANISAAIYKSEGAAREAAGKEIKIICDGNKNSKKYFKEFTQIRYTEYDLFGGLL
jgi:hypothetical protein